MPRKKPLPPKPAKGVGESGQLKRRRRGLGLPPQLCGRCGMPLKSRRGELFCPAHGHVVA